MKGKKAVVAVLLAIVAALLIAQGLIRVVRVYNNYRSDMLTYESRHLSSIVSSGARGLGWMLDGYAAMAEQFPSRPEFVFSEAEYLSSGDKNIMWSLMARPDLFRPGMTGSLAVYDAGGRFLASSSQQFPVNTGGDMAFGEAFSVRRDAQGEYWFLFAGSSDAGLLYELAVSVQTVFSYQSEASRVGQHGYLFMLDGGGSFAAYSGEGTTEACGMDVLFERYPALDRELPAQIAAEGSVDPDGFFVCRYPWSTMQGAGAQETLVVICPIPNTDGMLLLGAAMSFGEFNSLLSDTLSEITGVILLELVGALLLFFLAAWIQVLNRRNRLELEAVRERMELMEEINRQQQDLAHTERLQQLGVMTSGIVHEFNNLLTPIMGQSMLLLEELADREEAPEFESALNIYEASENARDMLRRMSGMGKKDVDMGFAPLEVGGLLQRTADLATLAKDPHIRLELLTPEEPMFVSGNDRLLTQALLNLCINASQAMGTEGTLTIEGAPEVRSGRAYAVIRVSDTGPGIPEEKMSSIYEPFYTTKGERGTGLGLAICQKIIETHKGTIRAENRPEGGAVFTVRIPVCELPEEE